MSPARSRARPAGRVAVATAALLLLAGCARPVSFDHCTMAPVRLNPGLSPEDFRIAVLTPPLAREAGEPRIEVEVRPVEGDPLRYRLELVRLEDDPRMVTRGTGRGVDYWHRYALGESAYADYRSYLAVADAPAGGMAEIEWTAWLARPPLMPAGTPIREVRVRTSDAVGYDSICRS
jgi:hypothetical protein